MKIEIVKCDLCEREVDAKDIAGKIEIAPNLDYNQLAYAKEEVCFQCLAVIRNKIDGLALNKARK